MFSEYSNFHIPCLTGTASMVCILFIIPSKLSPPMMSFFISSIAACRSIRSFIVHHPRPAIRTVHSSCCVKKPLITTSRTDPSVFPSTSIVFPPTMPYWFGFDGRKVRNNTCRPVTVKTFRYPTSVCFDVFFPFFQQRCYGIVSTNQITHRLSFLPTHSRILASVVH